MLSSRAEGGLSWVLPTCRWMHLEGGYQGENFSYDGNGFIYSGPFLRYEVSF